MKPTPLHPDAATVACNSPLAICDCGHAPSAHSDFTTGYGEYEGKTYCYACCAERDKAQMIRDGKTCLYLTTGNWQDATVSNWPGSLKFKARYRKGNHNIAGSRYDVWFIGPDGKQWYGIQYGENTQICHCRRTKN